jgi:hypothetical protein
MKKILITFAALASLLVLISPLAKAQYNSSNYSSNEVFFGSGGDLDSSSANYKGQTSVGGLGIDNVSSANYQAYSGFLTPNEPFLEMSIDTALVDLGTLDSASTKTGAASFHVRTYVNSGYTVQTISQPPSTTSGALNHTLIAKTTLGAPSVGTEEFGINLKANTVPVTFGANPSPQPNGSFANGQAASGYDTADQFQYNPGDIIACSGVSAPCSSGSGWGLTNYTISYIANITSVTPAGSYSMVHDLVAVATY